MAAQDRIERGETPPHAASGARRELGNVGLIQAESRSRSAMLTPARSKARSASK
jgi:hypothetical protein